MSDLVGLAEKEILRKEIMQLCNTAGEAGCSTQVLVAAVGKLGLDASRMEKELYYLQEKKMIRKERVENKRLGICRTFILSQQKEWIIWMGMVPMFRE